MRAEITISVQR